ncbi:MAG: hypothetical protein WA790_07240 [Sulfitobacter sp.]
MESKPISRFSSTAIVEYLGTTARVSGGVLAVVAIISLFIPLFEKTVTAFIAWRFGALGHVYYEIDAENEVTTHGQLRLLASNRFLFDDIKWGDKLQSATDVNFRDAPTKRSRTRFILSNPNCVIVLKVGEPYPVEKAKSGGWLYVGTTACGLFN